MVALNLPSAVDPFRIVRFVRRFIVADHEEYGLGVGVEVEPMRDRRSAILCVDLDTVADRATVHHVFEDGIAAFEIVTLELHVRPLRRIADAQLELRWRGVELRAQQFRVPATVSRPGLRDVEKPATPCVEEPAVLHIETEAEPAGQSHRDSSRRGVGKVRSVNHRSPQHLNDGPVSLFNKQARAISNAVRVGDGFRDRDSPRQVVDRSGHRSATA